MAPILASRETPVDYAALRTKSHSPGHELSFGTSFAKVGLEGRERSIRLFSTVLTL